MHLRWPGPIYMPIGYVFQSGFSAGMIEPISMIFGILNKEWSNFKKKFSCRYKNVWDIGICLKPHFYKKYNFEAYKIIYLISYI